MTLYQWMSNSGALNFSVNNIFFHQYFNPRHFFFPSIFLPAAFRRASKMANQVIAQAARKNWDQLGLFTLTFYGRIRTDGKIVVET